MSPQTKLTITFLKVALVFAAISLACDVRGVTRDVLDIRDWYVNDATGDDTNSCETPAAACLTINAAIDKATDLDVVHIAAGVYTDERYSSTVTVFINKNIILQGSGFTTTTINGRAREIALQVDNATVTLRDLTIANSQTGILVSGSPGIEGAQNLVLENSRIARNIAAGIRIHPSASAVINSSRIVRNGYNGEIPLEATDEERGALLRNYAIFNEGSLEIRDSIINNNYQWVIWSEGTAANLEIYTSTISNNSGTGVVHKGTATAIIQDSSISLNGEHGVYTRGSLEITNSTISQNRNLGVGENSETGEAINLTISYSTIFQNAIGLHITNPGVKTINNTLIVNSSNKDCSYDPAVAHISAENFDEDGTCDDALTYTWFELMIDPVLANNGGPTRNHALLPGSPAIDAATGTCLPADQRGASRPYGSGCDVGAYEFDPAFGATTMSLEDPDIELITVTPTQQDAATPTPQISFTPPLVTLDSLCWTGPGNQYGVVSSVKQGVEVELLGTGDLDGWLVVNNPLYNIPCWLPEDNLDLDPNLDLTTLKVFPVPPLPTPTITQAQPTATATPKPIVVAPNAPSSLAAAELKCNSNDGYIVKLTWKDNANNEDGYRVYRDGGLIATLGANATQYTDTPPGSGPYSYYVQAFNNAGTANSNNAQEDGCIW